MNLRFRLDRLLIALGIAVAMVGALVFWLGRDEREQRELQEDLGELELDDTRRAPSKIPKFVRPLGLGRDAGDERPQQIAVREPPPQGSPGDIDADEAIELAAAVIEELEALQDSGRKLDSEERAELYNRASGSLTALSMWIDGSDARERAVLEDTRAQMLGLMKQLKIKPTPYEPDRAFVRAHER